MSPRTEAIARRVLEAPASATVRIADLAADLRRRGAPVCHGRTLSTALQMAEERLRLPKSVYSFTLPLGAQLNKDGTALMLTGVLLFTAQAAGVQFTLGEILIILLVGLILSEGSGGIPGGGAVIAMIFVQAFHLPLEIAGIVIGVYRLIDMGNTTINVTGDMVASAVVARSEGWRKEEAFAADPPSPPRPSDVRVPSGR